MCGGRDEDKPNLRYPLPLDLDKEWLQYQIPDGIINRTYWTLETLKSDSNPTVARCVDWITNDL